MDTGPELETLMARYQAGDAAAAHALIAHLSPALYRFLALRSAGRADTDDLLQETWLRIHRVRHTYRAQAPLLPWVFAIARRVRIDHYRKFVRGHAREAPLEEAAHAAAAPAAGDELEALLAPLSDSQREVLEMLKVGGMSLEEVARVTSSSVGAVKQKVHRAYTKLRRTMNVMKPKKGQRGALS